MKACTGCQADKPCEDFSRDHTKADGRATRCKECRSASNAKYYERNAEHIKRRVREDWRSNRVARQRAARAWALANPEKMAEYRQRWRSNNRGQEREAYRQWQAERAAASGAYRMNRYISRSIWGVLKGRKAGRKWSDLVGYSADDLRRHLEARFKDGMTWGNYGAGWHVDHVLPIASFDFESTGEGAIRECWSLGNLQPLWATDNWRKNRW